MLTKQDIFDKIIDNKETIKSFGVTEIGLFGSYVRNEQTENSDIDILIDYKNGFSLYDLIDVEDYIKTLMSYKKVDVITKNGLSKYIGPYILNEVQYVKI